MVGRGCIPLPTVAIDSVAVIARSLAFAIVIAASFAIAVAIASVCHATDAEANGSTRRCPPVRATDQCTWTLAQWLKSVPVPLRKASSESGVSLALALSLLYWSSVWFSGAH